MQDSKVQKFLNSPAGQRFSKLAGMLGSDGEGERSNAAGMATRLLREAGLTWGEMMGAGTRQSSMGGQHTRIADLTTRNRILESQVRKLQDDQARMFSQDRSQKQEISRLRGELMDVMNQLRVAKTLGDEIEKLRKANSAFIATMADMADMSPEELVIRLEKIAGEYAGAKKAGPAPSGKPNQSFETALQTKLNAIVDEIEEHGVTRDWDAKFLESIRGLKYKISTRQLEVLRDIAGRARVQVNL